MYLKDFKEAEELRDCVSLAPQRATHLGCGTDKAATVTRTPVGWVMHCFRCGDKGFEYARVARAGGVAEVGLKSSDKFPTDLTYMAASIPEHMERLLSYGITKHPAVSTFWSEEKQRLMFPLFTVDGQAIAAGHSYAGKINPKATIAGLRSKWMVYRHPLDRDNALCFAPVAYGGTPMPTQTVFLVEDCISAVQIANMGTKLYPIAMLGLSIPKELLLFLSTLPNRVVVWADGDPAGMLRGRKVWEQLAFLRGDRINNFKFIIGRDPKDLDHKEMEAYLASVLS